MPAVERLLVFGAGMLVGVAMRGISKRRQGTVPTVQKTPTPNHDLNIEEAVSDTSGPPLFFSRTRFDMPRWGLKAGSANRILFTSAMDVEDAPSGSTIEQIYAYYFQILHDFQVVADGISAYADANPETPEAEALIGRYIRANSKLARIIIADVVNNPEVRRAVNRVGQVAEGLNGVARQLEQAPANLENLNKGLSLVESVTGVLKPVSV